MRLSRFLLGMSILLILYSGCTKSRIGSAEANPYTGTWESTYVYKSGYTNSLFFPVAIKLVQHTMTIQEDGTYKQSVVITYADDSDSTASFSGVYTYSDTEISFQTTGGIAEEKTIPEERLPEPETYVRQKKTLVSKDAYYAESPERNEKNELKYPIVLTFIKKNQLRVKLIEYSEKIMQEETA